MGPDDEWNLVAVSDEDIPIQRDGIITLIIAAADKTLSCAGIDLDMWSFSIIFLCSHNLRKDYITLL